MAQDGTMKWKRLAEQASRETDPGELSRITMELTRLLEEKQNERYFPPTIRQA